MTWHLAKSLDTLRKQVNTAYPKRSKSSDGTIGDQAHASRKSDHNPNAAGSVNALDITHDPASGCDAAKLAERLRITRDPRLNYIISNKKIASYDKDWKWRPYNGINAHTQHAHFSVRNVPKLYDDPGVWKGVTVIPMTQSRIAKAQVAQIAVGATAGSAAGFQLADVKDQVKTVAEISNNTGEIVAKVVTVSKTIPVGFWASIFETISSPLFLCIVAFISIAIAVFTIYWRWQMKQDGIA